MTTETPPADAGQGGASGAPPASWHGADYAQLVQTKGWKGPDDALKSYAELETFRGAPADRLIKLPEKPDDPAWADVRKRVGWAAPEKPEDYGIAVPEGYPAEYAQTIAQTAHKLGIPKDTLLALAAENQKYVEAAMKQQGETLAQRLKDADEAFAKAHGPKVAEAKELMIRTLEKAGIDGEALADIEQALAMSGDGSALAKFRQVIAQAGAATREAVIHTDGVGSAAMSPEQAQRTLETKRSNADWVTKALTRGTPEAEENIRLNMLATGQVPDEALVKRIASGIASGA